MYDALHAQVRGDFGFVTEVSSGPKLCYATAAAHAESVAGFSLSSKTPELLYES